jgi:hypothetical protein
MTSCSFSLCTILNTLIPRSCAFHEDLVRHRAAVKNEIVKAFSPLWAQLRSVISKSRF